MMLQLSSDQIDQQQVERWIAELDLGAEWREARLRPTDPADLLP